MSVGDAPWLLSQQVGQGTPEAFIALLAFWLTSLFASFGLFAPRNATSVLFLTLCAMAVAGAIGMILELEKGWNADPYFVTTDAPGRTLKFEQDHRDFGARSGLPPAIWLRRAD